MKKLVVCVCLCLFSAISYSQYYSYGTEPTFVQWKQIKTSNFQVIYPKGFDSVAQDFTKKLEFVYEACSKSLQHEPRKISVILHNRTNISNASVSWCPSQMDVYTISPQDQTSLEWYENLAIHEFRHVVQMDKTNQGLTHIFYFLLGEQASGIVSGIYLPKWLLEGDAVCAETALSNSGRGRQADFSKGLRAQFYDSTKGIYSYSKAYHGSYKDYVENEYCLGYYLLANTRSHYSIGFERKIIDNASLHPFNFRPLNNAAKSQSGLSRDELYKTMMEEQANEWKLKHDREIQTHYDTIAKAKSVYTSYINGMKYNDSTYFCERTGLDRISQLIRIEKGKEKAIRNTSFKSQEDRIQSNGQTIVWEETHFGTRWEMKQSSRIYLYDIAKNQIKHIRANHVFAPAISPSNERIAACETDKNGQNFLTIFDRKSKKILKQIATPENNALQNPSWNENGSKIVFIAQGSKGKRIVEYDCITELFNEILPYTYDDICTPLYWKEFVIFTSSYSGADNIYACDLRTNYISRITVGDFACKFPSITDSTLVYSNYTSNGYELAQIPLNPEFWHPLSAVRKEQFNIARTISNQEGGAIDFSLMTDTLYEAKRYSKLLHAINIHSWAPLYINYNGSEIDDESLGVQVHSQNHLGTTIASAGYRWIPKDNYRNGFVNIEYRGLFPVFSIEYARGPQVFREAYERMPKQIDTAEITYKRNDLSAIAYIPLNFSSKSFYRYIIPQAQFTWQRYDKMDIEPNKADLLFKDEMEAATFTVGFSISNKRKTATQELYPRWGQVLQCAYSCSPFNTETIFDDYAYATANLYFPGIKRSHSLNFYGGFEWNKKTTGYNFSRQIKMPRGYTEEIAIRKEMISFQANYAFPICYPDAEWGNFLYIKRLRCNAFVDFAQTLQVSSPENFSSFGAEVYADTHILHFIAPINIGVRFSVLPQEQKTYSEILLNINFKDI